MKIKLFWWTFFVALACILMGFTTTLAAQILGFVLLLGILFHEIITKKNIPVIGFIVISVMLFLNFIALLSDMSNGEPIWIVLDVIFWGFIMYFYGESNKKLKKSK